jgi:hypothetical protein
MNTNSAVAGFLASANPRVNSQPFAKFAPLCFPFR